MPTTVESSRVMLEPATGQPAPSARGRSAARGSATVPGRVGPLPSDARAHWGLRCMVMATVAPGLTTAPCVGSWLSTVCGTFTVVAGRIRRWSRCDDVVVVGEPTE